MPLPPSARSKANISKMKDHLRQNKMQVLDDRSSSNCTTPDKENELYLKNWVPKLKGKKLLVEGDLLDFGYELL